jgi:hypothetical protein
MHLRQSIIERSDRYFNDERHHNQHRHSRCVKKANETYNKAYRAKDAKDKQVEGGPYLIV